MKVALVILCKNQDKYAPAIAKGVLSQTVKPDRVLVVMDRPGLVERMNTRKAYEAVPGCEFLVVSSLPETLGRPPMNSRVVPFCAGHCRNLALEMLYDMDLVIFTDGDCIPLRKMVEAHVGAYEEGCVTVGRRVEIKLGSLDQRQEDKDHPVPIFWPEPRAVTRERFIADSGVVWTCNFGITQGAVRELKKMNSELYGTESVFHPAFTGRWGGEDGFLGMECFYWGIPIRTTAIMDGDGVTHIEHPRPDEKYDHEAFLSLLEVKRHELIILLNAIGKYDGKFIPLAELTSGTI